MRLPDPDIKFSEVFKTLKLGLDALDRLYRPDRGGFLGMVSNNSLKKGQFLTKNHFREFKVLRKWPPGHLSGCFLYQTDLFFQTKEFGNLQIVREGRNLKILGKNKFRKFKIWRPNTNLMPRARWMPWSNVFSVRPSARPSEFGSCFWKKINFEKNRKFS